MRPKFKILWKEYRMTNAEEFTLLNNIKKILL